jgi:uncharacterized protein
LRGRAIAVVLAALLLCQLGCSGHESRVNTALDALDRADPEGAIAELDLELEVEEPRALPADLEGDNALLVLDRATILQSMGAHELAQRDFGAADKAIDLLDLSRSAADDVGRYLFSDSVGRYRAPAFEKLLINTFNMMSYLARRDLNGARVETRRLAVVQKYLKDKNEPTALSGLGSYLAGFVQEKSGKRDPALLHYEEALAYQPYETLRTPLRALTGEKPRGEHVAALIGDSGPLPSLEEAGEAEIVVVVGYGRVPPKLPTRIPIGVALSLVAHDLSPSDHALANELVAKGLVTWVNFPRLGKGRGKYDMPSVSIDGRRQPLELAMDVEAEVRREWDENEGTVILSAITRLLARAAAGELVHRGTAAAGDGGAAGIAGLLAGLATTATLAVLDTPDTRSWVTLPSKLVVARVRLPPGRHDVSIRARGMKKRYRVDVARGDWAFVPMLALR